MAGAWAGRPRLVLRGPGWGWEEPGGAPFVLWWPIGRIMPQVLPRPAWLVVEALCFHVALPCPAPPVPAGPRGTQGGAAAGPAATWVAVEQPGKRLKPAAAAALLSRGASAPPAGEESEGEEGGGVASPSKARWNDEVLAHNAAIKADSRAMRGHHASFLEEHLQVGGGWAASPGCSTRRCRA